MCRVGTLDGTVLIGWLCVSPSGGHTCNLDTAMLCVGDTLAIRSTKRELKLYKLHM